MSTLELFFDLVFVFTITQLTSVLAHGHGWRGPAQGALALAIIWWIYAGYAWLTNQAGIGALRRQVLLLGGMAGLLVAALSLPRAFSGSGAAFGIGYAVVIAVHAGLFLRDSGAVFWAIARFNFTAAALVLVGGIAGGTTQYVLWAAAVVLVWAVSRLASVEEYSIAPGHFVERHGLVVIVAIGESVVAVGAGTPERSVTVALAAVSVLGLALSAMLWWSYFGGDDERAERALRDAEPAQRPQMVLDAYGLWHLPLLFGIVAIAAGEKLAVLHPFGELAAKPAIELALGAAIFLAGEAMFRRRLLIARPASRLAAAVLAAATIPLGTEVAAFAQLAALVVLLGGTLLAEHSHHSNKSFA